MPPAVQLLSAVTEGTSDSFQNTSDSAGQSAGASIGFTSSTSPRGDSSKKRDKDSDREEEKKDEAKRFMEQNFVKVKADIAVGDGEYLRAVAEIFEIQPNLRSTFYAKSKALYPELFRSNSMNAAETVDRLYQLAKTEA